MCVLQGHVLENATFAFIKKIHLFKVYFNFPYLQRGAKREEFSLFTAFK